MKFALFSAAASVAGAYNLVASSSGDVSVRLPRETALVAVDLDALNLGIGYNFLHYHSIAGTSLAEASADVTAAEADTAASGNAEGSASASGVFAGLAAGTAIPPSFYLASFDFSADGSGSATAVADDAADAATNAALDIDVSASAGFSGMVYYGLRERDSAGTEVKITPLAGGVAGFGLVYDLSEVTDSDGVKSAVMSASQGDLELKFTVVCSDESGVLNTGAVITPTSVETIVEINNYEYADQSNTLELLVAVASASAQATGTGSGTASGTATTLLTSGIGGDAVFTEFALVADVDGTADSAVSVEVVDYLKASATASGAVNGQVGTQILGDSITGLLEAAGTASGSASASYSLNLVTVSFPPGAASITYDPTVGAGAPPKKDVASSASQAAVSLAVFAGLFALNL